MLLILFVPLIDNHGDLVFRSPHNHRIRVFGVFCGRRIRAKNMELFRRSWCAIRSQLAVVGLTRYRYDGPYIVSRQFDAAL